MPLTAYYEAADGALAALSGTDEEQESTARESKIEDFVAACMKERGFTYFPAPSVSVEVEESLVVLPHDSLAIPYLPESLNEVKRVGYGISRPEEMGLVESTATSEELRNNEYRESLSVESQREYDLALIGSADEVGYADEATVAASCRSQGAVAFPPPSGPSTKDLDYWSTLVEPLNGVSEAFSVTIRFDGTPVELGPYALGRSPEMIELNDEYSRCVKEKAVGWDASWVSDAEGPVNAAKAVAPDGTEWTWVEGEVYVGEEVPYESRSLVGSQIEIEIAVVDFECRQQTDYVNRYARIQAEAENSYIADHRSEFESMMTGLEQLTGQG